MKQGWIDAIREMHADVPMYTFWDYKRNRWERDAGVRLDHLLLNAKAAKRLIDAGVDREVRGREGASDHAPAWIILKDVAAGHQKQNRTAPKAKRAKATRKSKQPTAPKRPLLVIDGDSFSRAKNQPGTRQRPWRESGGLNQLADRLEKLAVAENTSCPALSP